MLGQVFASRLLTTQQQNSSRRLMDSFADIAAGEIQFGPLVLHIIMMDHVPDQQYQHTYLTVTHTYSLQPNFEFQITKAFPPIQGTMCPSSSCSLMVPWTRLYEPVSRTRDPIWWHCSSRAESGHFHPRFLTCSGAAKLLYCFTDRYDWHFMDRYGFGRNVVAYA